VDKKNFIADSEFMSTVLVVVQRCALNCLLRIELGLVTDLSLFSWTPSHRHSVKEWEESYETLSDMVVPRSST